MAENLRLDSHKLIFHPEEVGRWNKGEFIPPIEVEISLSSACNHRCTFCGVEWMGYKPNILEKEILLKNLNQMAIAGVKSVVYAGEGEPLIHKDAIEIFAKTKEYGIDEAMSTNGVLLTREKAKVCLQNFTWIRFSIAAGSSQMYEDIHRAAPGDFQKVLSNLEGAVAIKKDQKLSTTLGIQLLWIPENKNEIVKLGKLAKNLGVDYFTVKPFRQTEENQLHLDVSYEEASEVKRELLELESSDFRIYMRENLMEDLCLKKSYNQCYGINFMSYIGATGDVFPCCTLLGRKEFSYGNIYEKDFLFLWKSAKTRTMMEKFSGENLEKYCLDGCRMEAINKYLYQLKNPNAHVNFI